MGVPVVAPQEIAADTRDHAGVGKRSAQKSGGRGCWGDVGVYVGERPDIESVPRVFERGGVVDGNSVDSVFPGDRAAAGESNVRQIDREVVVGLRVLAIGEHADVVRQSARGYKLELG